MLKIVRLTFALGCGIAIFICNIFTNNNVLTAKEPTPYAFLSNSLTARSAGLAGSTVSFENDAGGFLINPALLATHQGNNFNATFLKHILDINSGNVSYIYRDEKLGTFAGSVVYTNYGSFDYYDAHGNPTGGSFSANHIALAGSYAGEIGDRLYGGVSAKFIFNQLEKMNGFAFAVDAGLLYKLPDDRTNFGFSILNAGTEMKKMYDVSARIPLDVRLGFNHRLEGLPLNFNLGFNNLNDTGSFFSRFGNINIGGELYFGEYVQVRLGFDNYVRKNLAAEQNKGLTGISTGVGIITNIINVDYSVSIYTSDLFLHRFSINLRIPKE
jgi:hypothetical protein